MMLAERSVATLEKVNRLADILRDLWEENHGFSHMAVA